MNPGFEHRRAFTVVGIQTRVKQGSETSELFANIWERFEAESEVMESLAISKKYYGVNFPTDLEDISEYLAGMMVTDDSHVPDGLVKCNVPGGDYAIFECPIDRIGLCYQNVFTKWLPAASVMFNPRNPVFEEYPDKGSTLPVRIHIPVTKIEYSGKTQG
jgi:predicted transcriptional regulator YdeE